MGLEQLKGTKYNKYSIPYSIEKAKKLAFALMRMNGRGEAASQIEEEIGQNAVSFDEEGLVSPSGSAVNAYYSDFDDQTKNTEETGAHKAYLLNKRLNEQIRSIGGGNAFCRPFFELADAVSSDRGSLLEACMDNRYLEGAIDAVTSIFPRINDNNSAQAFTGNNGKGPLAPLNELYGGIKDIVELEYVKQGAARTGWQALSYKNYVKKLNDAQKNTIKAYEKLCRTENIDQYNNAMFGEEGAKLSDLTDRNSKLGIAMTVLKAQNAALAGGWSPDDCRIFGILAEIECGLEKSKKDYADYKKAHNENNPQYDAYIAEAEKDFLAIKSKVKVNEPGSDMAAVMEGIIAFTEKYKTKDAGNDISERFGSLGSTLSTREKNYAAEKENAENRFYTDLDRKMDLSTRGVYFGTREYDNLRRSVSAFGQRVGKGRTLDTEENKTDYDNLKKNLMKYIVRKEAEVEGKSNPNKNSVMRLNTMKEVFNSLVARFEPKLYEKVRVHKRLGEYIKSAEKMYREKNTRPVYQKLNALNTLIDGHISSGAALNRQQLGELSESYKSTISAVDKLLNSKKKNNPELAMLAKKLGKDYKTINKYIDNNKEAKITDIYEKSRAKVLTVDDFYANEKKGNALSERIKIDMGGKTGFFTAEKPGKDVVKEIARHKQEILERYALPGNFFERGNVKRILKVFEDAEGPLKKIRSHGQEERVLFFGTIQKCRDKLREKITEDILAQHGFRKRSQADFTVISELDLVTGLFDDLFGSNEQPMNNEQVQRMMGVLDFASERHILQNQENIRQGVVGNDKKASVDRRNSAMSDMADLFGMNGLIVHTENYRIKDKKTGKTIKGIVMDEAKGIDPDNYEQMEIGVSALKPENVSDSLQLKKDIANLQILDYVCGNMDRHSFNFFYKKDENGKVCGVLGIDNDTSFCVDDKPHESMSGIAPENMSVIPKSTWEKMQNMSSETMKGMLYGFGLSADAINKSVKRFESLKAKIAADQEFFNRSGALKGEIADGRIKVVDDDELKNIGFFSQLAKGEKVGEQGYAEKNLFVTVSAVSKEEYIDNCQVLFYNDCHKCSGIMKKNWTIARTMMKDEKKLEQGDNAFKEIRDIVKNQFAEGMAGMTNKKFRQDRINMCEKLKELRNKCDQYLQDHKGAAKLSENDRKRKELVEKLGKITNTMLSAVDRIEKLEVKENRFEQKATDVYRIERDISAAQASIKESESQLKLQSEQLVKKLDAKQKEKQRPNASFLEQERDRLRLSLVERMHKIPSSEAWQGPGESTKAMVEIAADLIVLKTIEKNLSKGKNGEIKYCGIDVTNKNTINDTRKTLIDKGEVEILARDNGIFSIDSNDAKRFAVKLMYPKAKQKSSADKFLEKVDSTIAKNVAVKPKNGKVIL